ncbi:MAG: hypothetical protein SGI83_17335 [Bacteroidota bacterium]|nr:hypothetical protein [Bacteroidota bacterium]
MQKVILFQKKALLYSLPFAFFILTSCSDNSKEETVVLTALQENLDRSTTTIQLSTESNMKFLSDKKTDPCTKERAEIWYAKAELVTNNTNKIYTYIENLKRRNKWDDSVLDSVIPKLNNYKQMNFTVDSSIMKEFAENFSFIDRFISLVNIVKEKELTNNSVLPLLALLKNDLKIIENKITAYCNTKVGCTIFTFNTYSAIIGQNSNYLKPGSELQITAGVGAFSRSAQPIITFNGARVELSEEGFSVYKMKVPGRAGNYIVPVNIKFFNQTTGKEEETNVNVEYTVAKEYNQ